MGAKSQGFDGFLSSKDALRKRARAFKPEDRAFSLSSKTSAAVSPCPLASRSDIQCLLILHQHRVQDSQGQEPSRAASRCTCNAFKYQNTLRPWSSVDRLYGLWLYE